MVFAIHWPTGIGWREISLNVPCPKPQSTCIPNDHIYHNSKHIIVMSKTQYQIASSDLPRHHSIFGSVTIWGFLLKPHFLWSSLLVCAIPVFKILLEALTHSSVEVNTWFWTSLCCSLQETTAHPATPVEGPLQLMRLNQLVSLSCF